MEFEPSLRGVNNKRVLKVLRRLFTKVVGALVESAYLLDVTEVNHLDILCGLLQKVVLALVDAYGAESEVDHEEALWKPGAAEDLVLTYALPQVARHGTEKELAILKLLLVKLVKLVV